MSPHPVARRGTPAGHRLAVPALRPRRLRGPTGPSAAVIHLLERLGRVYDVRRPPPTRVAARRA
ncbi:hypothetical protein [Streptomyces sp. BK205]|uniref:hypothetical protein n=1 Tax=Streptomyces sp. BK205 TaxID=2512164 RepID=UPI0010E04F7D|nr:hypothetical protein [Streptomyces sp. BK205]TCR24839.1 hypothetical protein EV578_10264 [Streptomyces sp. BK205]